MLPFVWGPKLLPAQAPNGSCTPTSTVDAATVADNELRFEAAKAAINAGDFDTLATVYQQFKASAVLDLVTPSTVREVLTVFLRFNSHWQMPTWLLP